MIKFESGVTLEVVVLEHVKDKEYVPYIESFNENRLLFSDNEEIPTYREIIFSCGTPLSFDNGEKAAYEGNMELASNYYQCYLWLGLRTYYDASFSFYGAGKNVVNETWTTPQFIKDMMERIDRVRVKDNG